MRKSNRPRLARALRGAHLEEGFEDMSGRMAEAQCYQRRISRQQLQLNKHLRGLLGAAAKIQDDGKQRYGT